jgi:hypothetical protein
MNIYIIEAKGPGRWDDWKPILTFNNPPSDLLMSNVRKANPGKTIRLRIVPIE